MQFYDCYVRPGGSILNEIARKGIGAAEIFVLRAVHGDDSVIKIENADNKNIKHRSERARLESVYGVAAVAKALGPYVPGSKLPMEVEIEDKGDAEAAAAPEGDAEGADEDRADE